MTYADNHRTFRLQFGICEGDHFARWDAAGELARRMPLLLNSDSTHTIPFLHDEIVDWINENIQHPFYVAGIGDMVSGHIDKNVVLQEFEDDHIRFTDDTDYVLFKLRWIG